MNQRWEIRIYEDGKLAHTAEVSGPIELGRQAAAEELLYATAIVAGRPRLVVTEEKSVSRNQALLEPLEGGCCQLTNISTNRAINLLDINGTLEPGAKRILEGETLIGFGRTTAIRLQPMNASRVADRELIDESLYKSLPNLDSDGPGQSFFGETAFQSLSAANLSQETRAVDRWVQAAMDVLESAANSADFYDKAARAVVDLAKLHSAWVLFFENGKWRQQARYISPRVGSSATKDFSQTVLRLVREKKQTFWQLPPSPTPEKMESLTGVDAFVAAPIFNRQWEVIGALCGNRQGVGLGIVDSIDEGEANFVQLLARCIAAGLARLEQEQAALKAQVQFANFFSPELSRQLTLQPDLLNVRDAEVTLLFCDIRGFSRISERLGAARTVDWISDVMDAISNCVRAESGVLVDYVGDETFAMWGAPEEQPDHAERACRAALAMLEQLPILNERWQGELKEPLDIGIGINTGIARVGNIGSSHKFKYGPLGNTVNLASRVQGATKHAKCKLLITGTTQAKLGPEFLTRRLCQVRVFNIAQAVDLYQLVPPGSPDWPEAKAVYEAALTEFENRRFSPAARILGNWRMQHGADAPALLLLHRTVQAMVEEKEDFDPVWQLPGK
ncbi:adenylate/guanylate cyclase domain-containing protein [Anatilimnocola floriformis]|uniref:adenylate/guanylate cyclase domain-containing protein n=1 Tax=Anatilimnocola floriformis TaxID=2948575 RepID=UPI0020C1D3B3|nr:adenylate/guanylate cyclase domain-containing protein [Anatilimnocola floriformis]